MVPLFLVTIPYCLELPMQICQGLKCLLGNNVVIYFFFSLFLLIARITLVTKLQPLNKMVRDNDRLIGPSWSFLFFNLVFDDGDKCSLKRTQLVLKGERHFKESESLDRLPLTNPEQFKQPVIDRSRRYQ